MEVPRDLEPTRQAFKAVRFDVLNEIVDEIKVVGRSHFVDLGEVDTEIYDVDYACPLSFSAFLTHSRLSCRDNPGGNDITPLSTAAIMRGRSKVKLLAGGRPAECCVLGISQLSLKGT